MASVSSILSPNLLQQHLTKPFTIPQQPNSKLSLHSLKSPNSPPISLRFSISHMGSNSKESKWVSAVAEETLVSTQDPLSEAARMVYIGNIPRTVNNDELRRIVEEHGAVEKAEVMYDKCSGRSRRFAFVMMKTVEDANAAIEKLNGTYLDENKMLILAILENQNLGKLTECAHSSPNLTQLAYKDF